MSDNNIPKGVDVFGFTTLAKLPKEKIVNGREISHNRTLQHQESKDISMEDMADAKKSLLFNSDMAIDTQIWDWGNLGFMSQLPALPGYDKPANLKSGSAGCLAKAASGKTQKEGWKSIEH